MGSSARLRRVSTIARATLVCSVFIAAGGCDSQQRDGYEEGKHYFRSFDGKRLPETPIDEIMTMASSELLQGLHYEGFFDADGRLVCFQNVVDGHPVWLSRYGYDGGDEPVWREFIDHEVGRWRRDDPWDGTAMRDTDLPIDGKVRTDCP